MKVVPRCYKCDQKIYFDNKIRNGYGLSIRLDDSDEPHRCNIEYRKTGFDESQKCYWCRKNIFFDRNYVSISGKCIPLDSNSGNPHVCDEE